MKTIKSKNEALEFFLTNSEDDVVCSYNGEEFVCDSYVEAVEFFDRFNT